MSNLKVLLQHQKWCQGDTRFSATATLSATMTLHSIPVNSNNKLNFIVNYRILQRQSKLVIITTHMKLTIIHSSYYTSHNGTQYNIAIMNAFHRLYFQVIKRATTFALLGDVTSKEMEMWQYGAS